jgi:hypothetical protein
MGFRDDGSTLIEIDSSRGVDGSNAITQIPEGYCDEMENADITTKGVIKCRKGYQTIIGGQNIGTGYPQPVSRFTATVVNNAAFSEAEWINRGYEDVYGPLTAAQITHMTGRYSFVVAASPVFTSRAVVSSVPGSFVDAQYVDYFGGVACKLSDYSALVANSAPWGTPRENSFPVRILCNDTGYTFTTRVESTYRYIRVTSALPIEFPITSEFCGAYILGDSNLVTYIDEFTLDVRFLNSLFPANFVITPAFYLFVTEYGSYGGDPVTNPIMTHYPSSRIQGLGAFTTPTGEEILTIAKAGKLYAKSENMFGVNLTTATITVGSNPSASITAVNGVYSLTMNKADSFGTEFYEPQDTIILTDSGGAYKYFTCTSVVIASTTVTLILVPDDAGYPTTINLSVNSPVHFIRNSDSPNAWTSSISTSQVVVFRQTTNPYDTTGKTFVFLGISKWKNTRGMDTRYNLYYSNEYLQVGQLESRPDLELNVPIATLNSTAYASHPTGGVFAYTGNRLASSDYAAEIINLSNLLPPVIQSWRSIPGSKSAIDCPIGADGARADVKLEFLFTYQVRDGLGRVFESGSSTLTDGIFFAKPSVDGAAYTENIEVVFRPPVFNPGSRWVGMRLVAYLRTILTEDLGYLQYETVIPVPTTYTSVDVVRVAMTLGKTPISAIVDNPKFVEQQGDKPNTSAPRARLLVEHNGRLVAGDITAPARTEIAIADFLSNGTPPYLQASDFITVPLGLKEISGVVRPPKNSSELTGFPVGYDFKTTQVKWWDSAVSTTGITIAYTDVSDQFSAVFRPLLDQGTGKPIKAAKYIFRAAGQGNVNFSIPLTKEQYSQDGKDVANSGTISANPELQTFGFRSKSKCTEFLLSGGTCPDIDKINMFPMVQIGEVTPEQVSRGDAYLDYADGSLYYYVKLTPVAPSGYAPIAQDLVLSPAANTEYPLIAIAGPGTLFNLSIGDTTIKNFDTDMVFFPVPAATAAAKPIVDVGTDKYYKYRLVPVIVNRKSVDVLGSTQPTFFIDNSDINKLVAFNSGASTTSDSYGMTIYAAPLKIDTGATGRVLVDATDTRVTPPVVFSGFSNIAETFTISKSPVGSLLTDVAVNDYICLELDDVDVKALPVESPIKSSSTYRVIATGATSITLYAKASQEQKISLPSFSHTTTGATSCVVKLKKLFETTTLGTGSANIQVLIETSVGDYSTASGRAFLLVRGDDDSSTSLRLSGHYDFQYQNVNLGTPGTRPFYVLTTGANGQRTAFDYSQISGVKHSYIIAVQDSGLFNTRGPWPVPVPLAVNSKYLQDLAAPVFGNVNVPGSIYHTIARRIASVQGFVSEGSAELGVSVDTGKVYGIGTANRWDNSVKGTITASNNNSTSTYIPPVRYKNRLQWTNRILSTQQNSLLIPMFKEGNLQDVYSGDDSEITGLASVQNTLLVTKRGSLFRAIFDDNDVMSLQRIQSPVGAYGMYNLPTTLSYAYFLNPTGVYYTDGNSVQNVFKLSKRFKENVVKSPYLMSKCSGYVDYEKKIMYLGVPYASRFYYQDANAFGQFVYSYNDGVMGWTVNTGIPATCWATYKDQHVFGTNDGRVCVSLSNVEEPRAYSDDGRVIKYALRTRFSDGGDRVRFKFYRSALFQFGTEGDVNFTTYYSTNFNNTEFPFQTYAVEGDSTTGAGWRADKFLKTLRETVAARVAQIAFTLVANVRYSAAPIYGIFLEGFKTNSRPVDQKNTPGNTRT